MIREELGEEASGNDADEFRERLKNLDAPEEVKEKLKKEELPQQEVEKYDLEEEINSVPLEDMIEKTPGEDGDDLMQISLFGESTPISSVDDASDKE